MSHSNEEPAPYGSGAPTKSASVKRVRTHLLREMKQRGERFTVLTSYDMYTAQVFDEAGINVILIGGNAANNVYGYPTSFPVRVDELIPLARAVARVSSGHSSWVTYHSAPGLTRAGVPDRGPLHEGSPRRCSQARGRHRNGPPDRTARSGGIPVFAHIGSHRSTSTLLADTVCRDAVTRAT